MQITATKRPSRVRAAIRRLKTQKVAGEWLLLFFWLYLFWNESVVRLTTGRRFWTSGLLLTALFTLVAALVLYCLCSLLPGRGCRRMTLVLVYVFLLFYISQLIYYYKFHCFYNVRSMGNGGQILEFWRIILKALWVKAIPLLALILPAVLMSLFGDIFGEFRVQRLTLRFLPLLAAVVLHFGIVAMLPLFGTSSSASAYHVFHDTNDFEQGTFRLGLLPAFRLEIHRLIFGFDGGKLMEVTELTQNEEPTEPPTPSTETPTQREAIEPTFGEPNVLPIDFDALSEKETDETILQLNQYFSEQTPTLKNEKTGMFAGCNLIEIVAEGFSYLAIDPELTPTLYRLQTEGFNFKNFYTAYWGVSTSDGEYVTLTGTIPKSGTWSFSDSARNAMPLTLAQQFKRLGYGAYAFHDHSHTYYHRNQSHPNLGYVFKAVGRGLDITNQWPESDVEMIDATTEDFVHQEPFHTYYLTVSGHLEYSFDGNSMAAKHRDEVANLPYSEPVRAYLACQIELDRALELLLQRLEEAGVLDNTVIVLSADHYPYGLTVKEQSELAGHDLDTQFELYRNACIIYKKGMKPETIERPCSSLDLLPTISNLFGLDFDSRLYMGQDIFSDAEPLIVFSDRSWLTERGSFYSINETVSSFTDKPMSEELVQHYNEIVANKFLVSQWVLEKDYWRTIFGDNLPPDDAQENETQPSDVADSTPSETDSGKPSEPYS